MPTRPAVPRRKKPPTPASGARNRPAVEKRLMAAVGKVLSSKGFADLGVNTVARAAGVNKVLIYRYFGDLDGLVEAYARSSDFFPGAEELLQDRDALLRLAPEERLVAFTERYVAALRRRPRTVAVLAMEVAGPTPFHAALEEARESVGRSLMEALGADIPPAVDVPALATWITGAVHYLLVRARQVRVFNGVPIGTDQGWERMLAALRPMARGAMAAAHADPVGVRIR